MRASEFNYPYPVLGVPGSILGEMPEVKMVEHLPLKERVLDPYRWDFDIDVKNEDIKKLIAEGKAQYMCEVMCSATLLRKCTFSRNNHFSVELFRREVNKRVEFGLYVVATERLPEYANSAANEDYKEAQPFDIGKGAPLALLKFYRWDADLCYEDLTSLRSILQFVPNADSREDFVRIETDGPYIRVEIPLAQYDSFMKVAHESSMANIVHSTLVLFALQTALVAYSKEETHRWERALKAIVSRDERFRDYELGNKDDAAQIALMLLNNPFKRLSESLPTLLPEAKSNGPGSDEDVDED